MIMHSKSLRELPNVNKRVSSPNLLILSQFHKHILKTRTMLFPTTFISASEKIGVGLKKTTTKKQNKKKKNKRLIFFYLISPGEELSDIPVFIFFSVRN